MLRGLNRENDELRAEIARMTAEIARLKLRKGSFW
jgi:uncharacterized small protein (DUF1192 family)